MLDSLTTSWKQVLGRSEIGFTRIPELGQDWAAIERRAEQVKSARKIVIIGIGGSSLGTQVFVQGLAPVIKNREVYFLESPDPARWQSLNSLTPGDHHVVIVSKSGNTLETIAWIEKLQATDPRWLADGACTMIASPVEGMLQAWAKQKDIPLLWIPKNVGGRFSVLTAAGMFPAALLGLDLKAFREGAAWALGHVDLASTLSARVLESWAAGEWITQMWTYSEGLCKFGEWWQQLWGESLAKRLNRQGQPAVRASTPMACAGPRDQHSLVQQLIEGARDKFVLINRVGTVEGDSQTFQPKLVNGTVLTGKTISLGQIVGIEAEAFARSLGDVEIPFATVQIDSINEKSLGALFMLWQMVIAQLGEHMDIDAFNQPGVELGKVYAGELLKR